jgi:ribosomal protein S18 acetylase RimI-like enzyme
MGYAQIMPSHFLRAMSVEERTLAWEQTLVNDELCHAVWVAALGASVLGWVTYGPSRDNDIDPHTGEVHGLYVDPLHWQEGIGGALMDHALLRLATDGMTRATLWVLEANARGIRFYEAKGFHPDGTRGLYARKWTTQPQLRLAKQLDGPATG